MILTLIRRHLEISKWAYAGGRFAVLGFFAWRHCNLAKPAFITSLRLIFAFSRDFERNEDDTTTIGWKPAQPLCVH